MFRGTNILEYITNRKNLEINFMTSIRMFYFNMNVHVDFLFSAVLAEWTLKLWHYTAFEFHVPENIFLVFIWTTAAVRAPEKIRAAHSETLDTLADGFRAYKINWYYWNCFRFIPLKIQIFTLRFCIRGSGNRMCLIQKMWMCTWKKNVCQ